MRRGIRLTLIWSLLVPSAAGLHAQSADADKVTFEVASVKPNKLNGAQQNFQCCAGGRVAITSFPLRQLITIAYASDAIQTPGQVVGGPSWLSDRFDIVAKAEGDPAPDAQGRPTRLIAMLRTLLEERFQVKVHTEMRETQTYALMLASKDGRLGPRLKPSECHGPDIAPPPDPTGQSHPCGRFWGTLTGNQNARGIPIAMLARSWRSSQGQVARASPATDARTTASAVTGASLRTPSRAKLRPLQERRSRRTEERS
jgi:uncharacterized protein (TIGR03435 family)